MKELIRKAVSLVLVVAFLIPTCVSAEKKEKGVAEIYSKNSILVDQMTGRVITEKKADEQVPLASISKVMTFYVAQDAIKNGEVKLTDRVKITKPMLKVSGSTMHLKENEKVSLDELLKGLLIVSANDAALAIAYHVCDGDLDAFVERMNQKAKDIGMKKTYFINPNGLPVYDWSKPEGTEPEQNHSTARDVYRMAKNLLEDYEDETVAITGARSISSPERGCDYYNTNLLLHTYPNVDGMKTGYTDGAGYCLVFTNRMDIGTSEPKNRMIGVVMGNWCKEDRAASSTALYKLGETYHTECVCKKGEAVGKGNVEDIKALSDVTLETKEDFYAVLRDNEKVNEKISYRKVEGSLNEESVIADLQYIDEYGDVVASVPLVSPDLEHVSILSRCRIFGHKFKRLINIDRTDEKKDLPYAIAE